MISRAAQFFHDSGYLFLQLSLFSEGPYSVKDSEWNYSDVPHAYYVHSCMSPLSLICKEGYASSIFMQKIGPLTLPCALYQIHQDPQAHDYLMVVLTTPILVRTTHNQTQSGCITKTHYRFYYKGFLGLLLALFARWATKRNYKILMSEDLPMRYQRHRLRQRGVRFSYDSQRLIGFRETLEVSQTHVDATSVFHGQSSILVPVVGERGDLQLPETFLRVTWAEGKLCIWPLICPHEGADLANCSIESSSKSIACPWHGRQLPALAVLPIETLTESIGFQYCKQEFSASFRISSREESDLTLMINAEGPKMRGCPLNADDGRNSH